MRTTGFREREAFRNFCILEKTPFRNCAISDELSILLGVLCFVVTTTTIVRCCGTISQIQQRDCPLNGGCRVLVGT